MFTRILAIVVVAALLASPSVAQNNYSKAHGVLWDLSQANADAVVSADARTITTALPPAPSINNQTAARFARMTLQFGSSGSGLPPNSWISAVAQGQYGTKVACSRSNYHINCSADPIWLRSLAQQTSVIMEVGGAGMQGNLKPRITWVFKPTPAGEVFISQITGPSSVTHGALAQFTLQLAAPAPPGGQVVDWKLDPGGCFVALPGNVPFQSTSFNQVTVAAGEQYKSFGVGVRENCTFSAAVLHTWTNRRIDQTPYYRKHSFALAPRRR